MPKRDYIGFQDHSVALGYLITFRTYGTWLHGDERGSVDRRYFNRYGTPRISPSEEKVERRTQLLSDEPFLMKANERHIVEAAIREVCIVRSYALHGLHVRTNHVHVVTGNHGQPERMMDSFKAYSTRALRKAGLVATERKLWSRHGSTKYLWTEAHIGSATDYVVNGQGDDLPTFDRGAD